MEKLVVEPTVQPIAEPVQSEIAEIVKIPDVRVSKYPVTQSYKQLPCQDRAISKSVLAAGAPIGGTVRLFTQSSNVVNELCVTCLYTQ